MDVPPPLVLAHGGSGAGWDELLIFAVPALIFLGYLVGHWRESRKETKGESTPAQSANRNGPGSGS